MANTLTIFKRVGNIFVHRHNNIPDTDFGLSDFEVSIDGNTFHIVEKDGARRYDYQINDITIIDQTGSGTPETYTTLLSLVTRLQAIGYTPYLNNVGLTGNIIDALFGANSPSAANPFATMQDISGSGVAPYTGEFTWRTGDDDDFVLDAGVFINAVFINGSFVMKSSGGWIQTGAVLSVTQDKNDGDIIEPIGIKNL